MPITLDGTNGITTNSGTLISATTIGVGGTTPSTSGAGITFPATQSASTDANTLDDYEEGTYSPTVNNGITSPTYSLQYGTYTKIGRFVSFAFQLAVTGGTRTSGALQITLPFTPSSTSTHRAFGAYWTYADNSTLGSLTTNVPFLYIANGNSSLLFYNAAGGTFVGTDLTTATPEFYITGSFITG